MKIKYWAFAIASVMSCISMSIIAVTEDEMRQQAYFTQAKRELEEARRLHEKTEYSKAVTHYGLAMKMLEGAPSGNSLHKECAQGIAECLYRVALSENVAGHHDRARKLLEKAADMDYPKARSLLLKWDSMSSTQNPVVNSSGDAPHSVKENPAHKAGEVKSVLLPGGKGMDFVWCPPGQFIKDGKQITFKDGFWIGKYEVSEREWKSVFGDSSLRVSKDDWYPVDCAVIDALMFIDEINISAEYDVALPSGLQWEYAATAGGKSICNYNTTWCKDNSGDVVHEVGKKDPNKWGIYDIYGNVSEWCSDICVGNGENETPQVVDVSGRELPKAESEFVTAMFGGEYEESRHLVKGGNFKTVLRKCGEVDVEYDNRTQIYRPTGFRLCLFEQKSSKRKPRRGSLPLFIDHEKAITQLREACLQYDLNFIDEINNSNLSQDDVDWIKREERLYKFNFENIKAADRKLVAKSIVKVLNDLRSAHIKVALVKASARSRGVDLSRKLPREFEDDGTIGFSAVKNIPLKIQLLLQDRCEWLKITTDISERTQKTLKDIEVVACFLKGRSELLKYLIEGTAFDKLRLKIESERPVDVNQLNQIIFHSKDIEKCFNAVYQKHRKCFVNVTAGNMRGSGFVCNVDGDYYLYTNKHVLDGGKPFFATMEDGAHLKFDMLQIAQNLDVARCRLRNVPDNVASWLEMRQRSPDMSEDIAVIGNSDGAGVQTILKGKIVGIGPDLFEISAEIVHGNSGSPVLDRLGNVIGIATFAVDGSDANDSIKKDTRFAGVRRFAIKLTSPIQWQTVNPSTYLRSRGR